MNNVYVAFVNSIGKKWKYKQKPICTVVRYACHQVVLSLYFIGFQRSIAKFSLRFYHIFAGFQSHEVPSIGIQCQLVRFLLFIIHA